MTETQQIAFIKDHFLEMPIRQIAREIGRSRSFIRGVMNRNNLVVPQDIMKKRKAMTRFKKGHISFNKGMKMEEWCSPDTISRFRANSYTKGHKPHNTKKDFHITLRNDNGDNKYYWIRIREGKWMLLHRYLWELTHGPIPSGCNIQFKDGNSQNCTLENLYMVSRKDQLRVNYNGGKDLSFEIRMTIKLIYKLKEAINEKQNNRS